MGLSRTPRSVRNAVGTSELPIVTVMTACKIMDVGKLGEACDPFAGGHRCRGAQWRELCRVEGTVRRGGDRLRISVQLVDAETRNQLWSQRYEGATTDIFAFQDHIAAQVAGAIHPAVRNAEIDIARRKLPGSLRAYDLVLQADPKIWSQRPQDNGQAIAAHARAHSADRSQSRSSGWRECLELDRLSDQRRPP